MDSSGRHHLQNTSHQKHADIGLSFTLDVLNRHTPTTAHHHPAERRRSLDGTELKYPLEAQNPGGNTVDIDYGTDNGTTWIRMATRAADTGWYQWNAPGPATTTAKARIRFHETPSVNDTSDAVFTVVSP